MGKTTTDRLDAEFEPGARSARFREQPTERGADAPTATGAGRRAEFDPPEQVARQRGLVERFREEMLIESSVRDDETGEAGAAYRAALVTEEHLGAYEQASRRVHGLSGFRSPTLPDRRLYRRILRATGESEPILGSLERSVRQSEEPAASLLAVEGAHTAWRTGADSEGVEAWLNRASRGLPESVCSWTRFRLAQLRVDTALEEGDVDRAVRHLRAAVSILEDGELAAVLRSRLAAICHVRGELEEAVEHLSELRATGNLPDSLGDLLRFVHFERGAVEEARRCCADFGTSASTPRGAVVGALAVWEGEESDGRRALGTLREASERESGDATLLHLRHRLLESGRGGMMDSPAREEELISVLNDRLEVVDSPAERLSILIRLGGLYEEVGGMDEAAAAVYREAIDLEPDCAAAIRALGRLYARRDNWSALADLYEHELEHLEFSTRKWRHHVRVAELYERKLRDPRAALEHYRSALEERSNYLPALKAAARLLTELEEWAELADLFLSTVEEAPTRRRKLYLLDRAAEVAERRLDRPEIAIGAWEEILEIADEYPRAYSALGRLYAETRRWEDLVDLKLREVDEVDDDEEAAALYLRAAEICAKRLEETSRAEEFYRRALTLVPDFLPALEGLGRLYAEDDRWEEIARMSERELHEMQPGPEVARQMEVLAEILDERLDRPEDAAAVYARLEEGPHGGGHSRDVLLRLRTEAEDWTRAVAVLEEKAAERTGESRAELLGHAALIEEWFRSRRGRAYELYCAALDGKPVNRHWLEGIARTWGASEEGAAEVANRLEAYVVEPLGPDLLDRYFELIARLRERGESSTQAGRAHRIHGDPENRENHLVLQLAMATDGERDALEDARRRHPRCDLEELAELPRTDLDEQNRELLGDCVDRLSDPERRLLAGELPPGAATELFEEGDPEHLRLRDDLERIKSGEKPPSLDGEAGLEGFSLQRLRAILAEDEGLYRTFKRWTYDELDNRRRRDIAVRRLIRLSEMARRTGRSDQAEQVNRQAAILVFRSVGDDGELHPSISTERLEGDVDESTVELLYDSLQSSEQWELVRTCLRAHVGREGLTDEQRVALFTELAAVCEDQLDDIEGAIRAVRHSWQVGERPEQLCELVRLDRKAGDLEEAVCHQRRHYQVVGDSDEARDDDLIESGLRLAELLEAVDQRGQAVSILEDLREEFPESEGRSRVLRRLAHAYVEADEPESAVESFHEYLTDRVTRENLEDWRELVRLHDDRLGSPQTAYELQWRIAREFPGSERDLERLVDLAHRADSIESCVERLVERAEQEEGEDRETLLMRAARIAQEELQDWERADRLCARVLDCASDGTERELEALRRRVVCSSRLAGREEEALGVFGRLLERDPFEPAAFRAMLQLFERERAFDRARLTRQALEAMNCEVERTDVRTKTTPARAFDDETIERHLLPERLGAETFHALRRVVPLADKVFTDELAGEENLDGRALEDEGMHSALGDAMAAFDTSRYYPEVGEEGPPSPRVTGSGAPEIWFPRRLVADLESVEHHFVAGYLAALGWSGCASLIELEGRSLFHLLEGTWLRQRGEGFSGNPADESQRISEAIGSPFLAVARRRAARAIEPAVEELAGVRAQIWPDALEEFAARSGLVLCGDLSAAIRCLLLFRGWDLEFGRAETREQIGRMDLVGRLIRFAFSEDYLEARYAVGLSGRPSEIELY